MRAYFTSSGIVLYLSGLCLAICASTNVIAADLINESPKVVIAEPLAPVNLLNYTENFAKQDIAPAPLQQDQTVVQTPGTIQTPDESCAPTCGEVSCNPCCPRWTLGVEAVWLSPQVHSQFAGYEITNGYDVISEFNGSPASGLYATPRISLGYQFCRWGIQGRYWRMSEWNNRFVPPESGEHYYQGCPTNNAFDENGSNGLFRAETVDLEVTRLFCCGCSKNLFSFGLRYAQLDESRSVFASRFEDDAYYSGSAFIRNEFSGTGLTMGWAGYRPLPCRNFSLFYSLRGSVVWDGNTLHEVETRSSILTLGSAAGSVNGALASDSGSMFIGEIQLGVQWNFELVRNRSDAFLRLALEYQYWDSDDSGRAAAFSVAGVQGGVIGTALARSGDTRTDLIGFSVATGFTW